MRAAVAGAERLVCDVGPVIINDTVMLPLRVVFEAIDIIGDIMKMSSSGQRIDSPAITVDNRTLVPLRACTADFTDKRA